MDHKQHEISEHREAAGDAMDQAIPHMAGNIATGRAEADMLFHEHVAQEATCS